MLTYLAALAAVIWFDTVVNSSGDLALGAALAVDDVPEGVSKGIGRAIGRLVDWGGLTKFVQAFSDPVLAVLCIALIYGSVLATAIVVVALGCSTIKARIRAEAEIDLVLARRGIVRIRTGSARMWALLAMAGLIIALCVIMIMALLIWSERAKADYQRGVYFCGRFADQAAKVLIADPERRSKASWMLLAAASQLGDYNSGRQTVKLFKKWTRSREHTSSNQPPDHEREQLIYNTEFKNAFRDYLFAVSFLTRERETSRQLRLIAALPGRDGPLIDLAYLFLSRPWTRHIVEFWPWAAQMPSVTVAAGPRVEFGPAVMAGPPTWTGPAE